MVYLLSPPVAPAELLRLPVCGSISDLSAGPGVVALALRDSGVWLLDAISPSLPPLASTAAGETWDQLHWESGDLWGRNRTNELARWHWDGVQLVELDRFSVPRVSAFDTWQTTLVMADSNRFVTVWNLQPGGPPVPLDSFTTRYVVSRLALRADTVWVVDRDAVLRAELQGSQTVSEPMILPSRVLLDQPYPNPFNGGVTLPLHLRPGFWSVTIVDLLGRTVERWQGTSKSDRPQRVVWMPEKDGPRASGLYFVHVENEGATQTQRIVYLK